MKPGLLILFLTMPCACFATAEVVSFGPTLCAPGEHMVSGTCTPMTQGRCPDDTYQTPILISSFSAPLADTNSCINAYGLIAEMPTNFYPLYDGNMVDFGASLCPENEQMVSGACAPIEQENCPDGTYLTAVDRSSFSALYADGTSCVNAYGLIANMPTNFYPLYNGNLVNFGASLCPENEQMVSGTCEPIVQNPCPAGMYATAVDQATFSSPYADGETCMNAYGIIAEMPTNWNPLYNGILVGMGAPQLCGTDTYFDGTSCVSYERGDCPEQMHDISVADDTIVPRIDGVCESGYTKFAMGISCDSGELTSGGMCAMLCAPGLRYTDIGTCGALCGDHPMWIKSNTGMALPLYATKMTSPAMGVMTDYGACYVNMVPQKEKGTLNFQFNGGFYHATD